MPTKKTPKTNSDDRALLFDHARHAAEAAAARSTLADAEEAVPVAESAEEEASEALELIEASLGTDPDITAEVLGQARLALEVAQAKLNSARVRFGIAQRSVASLNTDVRAAEALMPLVRSVLHPSVPVIAVPGHLHTKPALVDLRPVAVLVQTAPADLDAAGWLSTRQHEPVLLQVHHVAGLHAAPDNEAVFAAAISSSDVSLREDHAHQMRTVSETVYTTGAGEEVTIRQLQLNVNAAAPAVMVIEQQGDAASLARRVEHMLRRVFADRGDHGSDAGVAADLVREGEDTDGVTTRVWSVRTQWASRVGTHGEQVELVTDGVRRLVGRPVGGHGRVVSAHITSTGVPEALGQHWGFRDVMLEVVTEARNVSEHDLAA